MYIMWARSKYSNAILITGLTAFANPKRDTATGLRQGKKRQGAELRNKVTTVPTAAQSQSVIGPIMSLCAHGTRYVKAQGKPTQPS